MSFSATLKTSQYPQPNQTCLTQSEDYSLWSLQVLCIQKSASKSPCCQQPKSYSLWWKLPRSQSSSKTHALDNLQAWSTNACTYPAKEHASLRTNPESKSRKPKTPNLKWSPSLLTISICQIRPLIRLWIELCIKKSFQNQYGQEPLCWSWKLWRDQSLGLYCRFEE